LHDLVVQALVNEQARACRAHLALVEEDRPGRGIRGSLDIGVREDDVRALTAELEPHALEIRLRRGLHDRASDIGGTSEGQDVDITVSGERRTCIDAEPVHDVEYAWRNTGLKRELGQEQGGERRLLSRLQDNGAPGSQRRPELPGSHDQREVPGDDRTDDPRGLAGDEG